LAGARRIQFMIAGVDFIPLGELPEGVPVVTGASGGETHTHTHFTDNIIRAGLNYQFH
jgi:hypothetical protein